MASIATRDPHVAAPDRTRSGRNWLSRFVDAVKRSRQAAAEREVHRLVEHDPNAAVRDRRETFV